MRTKTNISINNNSIFVQGNFRAAKIEDGYKIGPGTATSALVLYPGNKIIVGHNTYSFILGSIKKNKKGRLSCTIDGYKKGYMIDNTSVMLAVTTAAARSGLFTRCKY